MTTHRCRECREVLDLSAFYKPRKDGTYDWKCKSCKRAYDRERRANRSPLDRDRDREYYREWRRKTYNSTARRAARILENMQSSTRKKGLEPVEFTRDEIERIISGGRCEITGIPFEFSPKGERPSPWTPSPDRIDPARGYTKDNVQWVCFMYNTMKLDHGPDDVRRFIEAIRAEGNF